MPHTAVDHDSARDQSRYAALIRKYGYNPGMTFVAGFYNFSIELNQADQGLFVAFRLKTPRHELESPQHFYARMTSFLHCYRQGQEFTRDTLDPKLPTIWEKDAVGALHLWVKVGLCDKRTIEVSLKQHPKAMHVVYFFEESQKQSFCHHLRGSKTNWIRDVQFYQLCPSFLEKLAMYESSSPQWTVTIVDNRIYINVDGNDLESDISPIDIWEAYQESLNSHQAQTADAVETTLPGS